MIFAVGQKGELMSDLIERQAVIDICSNAIDIWHGMLGEGIVIAVRKKIEELPSAEPEIVRCKDCANYDTDWTPETVPDRHYCFVMDGMMPKDGFCNYAERRTDA